MERRDAEKKKRRIPPSLRRRALVSCDRCTKRRAKCVRPAGSDQAAACQSCLESGTPCQSTLPRKQRIYGSVETLSTRYRLLDALVRDLYPDEDTDNIESLQSILDAHNISISLTGGHDLVEDVFHHRPAQGVLSTHLPTGTPEPALVATNYDSSNPFEGASDTVPEEKLIPTPYGQSHYIGPSSSFGFVITVKHLVAEVNTASKASRPNDEGTLLRSDFAGLRTSRALEPHSPDERQNIREEQIEIDAEEPVVSAQPQKRKRQDVPRHTGPATDLTLSRRSRKDPLSVFMPLRKVADALVEAYFDQVHSSYPLFHRGRFQLRFESTWTEQKKAYREFDPGWICCIFMIFVFGAQVLEHHDKKQSVQIQSRYLDLVQSRLNLLISTTSLVNIQALLLLILHQHNACERNTAWMLLGCVSRMALALGMHRDGTTGGFDAMEREIRRRVWWTLYSFEQNLCVILGRPSAIDDTEVNVNLPNEAMLDTGDIPPSYVDHSVRLTKLLVKIKRKIYAAPIDSAQRITSTTTSLANHFLSELDSWLRNLPPYLRLEGLSLLPKHRRAILLLHIEYRYAQTLVSRPFILRKVTLQVACRLDKQNRPPDLDSDELLLSHACGSHAREALILIYQLATCGILDGVAWIDMFYIFHSVLIISVDFLARLRHEADTEEDVARKMAVRDVVSAVRNTQLCPTFAILTQVALQLAKIVGIFDDASPDAEAQQRIEAARGAQSLPGQQPNDIFDSRAQSNMEEIISQMFQNATEDLPWDFFEFDSYGSLDSSNFYNPPIAMASTFTTREVFEDGSVSSNMFSDHIYSNRM